MERVRRLEARTMVAAGTLESVTSMNPAEIDGVLAAAEGQRATPAVAGGIQ
jgi:hypothetical protein